MTKKINNLAVGSFILGTLVLAFVSAIFFSGGNYFTDKERVVMYFDGSVQGLQIGSPIKLKGVDLGEIVNIEVMFLHDYRTVVNMVTADLILKRIHRSDDISEDDIFNQLISKGLRAQLNYQSLLTGMLYVELDFYPDSELRLLNLQSQHREFPTTKTDFESLFNQLKGVDLVSISNRLASVLDSMDTILKNGAVEHAVSDFSVAAQAIAKTMDSFSSVSSLLETQLPPLSQKLTASIDGFTVLVNETNHQLPMLTTEFVATLTELRVAIESINETMKTAEAAISDDSPLIEKLTRSAEEVSRAARAIRLLGETLEQQPEAMLRGKRGSE